MQDVNIYIEASIRGPARKDGEYLYILECFVDKVPVTREGRGQIEKTTENQLALTALEEALKRLNQACSLRIYTQCQHIIHAMGNGWARQWQKNEWKTARGTQVKNAQLWDGVLNQLDKHLYIFTDEYHSYRPWMEEQIVGWQRKLM